MKHFLNLELLSIDLLYTYTCISHSFECNMRNILPVSLILQTYFTSENYCVKSVPIQSEYGEICSISPYSFRMRENTDQKNSEYGHFSRSEYLSYCAIKL